MDKSLQRGRSRGKNPAQIAEELGYITDYRAPDTRAVCKDAADKCLTVHPEGNLLDFHSEVFFRKFYRARPLGGPGSHLVKFFVCHPSEDRHAIRIRKFPKTSNVNLLMTY